MSITVPQHMPVCYVLPLACVSCPCSGIILSYNQLTGTVPESFAALFPEAGQLDNLDLRCNNLTLPVPAIVADACVGQYNEEYCELAPQDC